MQEHVHAMSPEEGGRRREEKKKGKVACGPIDTCFALPLLF